MISPESALQALNDARAVQAGVASRMRCPPHMHLAFGLIMGAMVAGPAAPSPYNFVVLVLALAGVAAMFRYQRKRFGFFINGYRRGRTLWVTLPLLAITEAMLFGGLWLKLERNLAWPSLVFGAVTVVFATMASYAWQAVYRGEMAEGVVGASR